MPRRKSSLLNDLSTADLKRLLAARERIDVLEEERAKLVKGLAKVEEELGKLMSTATRGGSGGVKKVRRKKAAKKATRKKATPRKTAGEKMKLEDVIVSVIKKKRSAIAYQELKARIIKGKLFKTKSGNFDNVLRRTLSTSKKVKRVGRGIYNVD